MTFADDFRNALPIMMTIVIEYWRVRLCKSVNYLKSKINSHTSTRNYDIIRMGGISQVVWSMCKGCYKIVLPDISQAPLKETIAKLSQRNYQSLEDCDSDPNILNVENGLLDMEKMKLLPHSP